MRAVKSFQYSQTIGFYAQNGRGFNNPVDVAFGAEGMMYVVNRAGSDIASRMSYKRVTMCTLDETFHGEFSSGGRGAGQLMWPVAITSDTAGNLYISDEALQCISVFNGQGQFLDQWGVQGKGEGEFDRPSGLAFNADGELLVADGLNNRIQRYSKDGDFLGQWGQSGTSDGELQMPWGLAVDRENAVIVADWRNDRVQKFDAQGAFVSSWGRSGSGEGELNRPAGVATDAEGLIYVADWGNERVQVFSPDGDVVAILYGEAGLSSWAQEYFISNQDELAERERADLDPELDTLPFQRSTSETLREQAASVEHRFWGPISIKLDQEGRIFVVESCRHRMQVYTKEL